MDFISASLFEGQVHESIHISNNVVILCSENTMWPAIAYCKRQRDVFHMCDDTLNWILGVFQHGISVCSYSCSFKLKPLPI